MPARGRFHALVEPPEHGARRGAGVARWSAAAMTEREAAILLAGGRLSVWRGHGPPPLQLPPALASES